MDFEQSWGVHTADRSTIILSPRPASGASDDAPTEEHAAHVPGTPGGDPPLLWVAVSRDRTTT